MREARNCEIKFGASRASLAHASEGAEGGTEHVGTAASAVRPWRFLPRRLSAAKLYEGNHEAINRITDHHQCQLRRPDARNHCALGRKPCPRRARAHA